MIANLKDSLGIISETAGKSIRTDRIAAVGGGQSTDRRSAVFPAMADAPGSGIYSTFPDPVVLVAYAVFVPSSDESMFQFMLRIFHSMGVLFEPKGP